MNPLHIDIYETEDAVIVRLAGDAGIQAAQALEMPLQRIVASQVALVIFDLVGLEHAASLFLGTLVNFRRGMISRGGRVQLAGVQPRILETLQISRLDQLFELIASAPVAVVQ
jgi:anti-anti-sigma factor